jgi:cytoskeletal protein CcmA (bactofilin family)
VDKLKSAFFRKEYLIAMSQGKRRKEIVFQSHTEEAKRPANPEQKPLDFSRLGKGLRFNGEIRGEEDLVLDGRFKGTIDLGNHNLVINPNSQVDAEIHVRNITISGRVSGNIHAKGKVQINADGRVLGDISSSRISVMDGAQFKGSVKVLKSSASEIQLKKIG